MVSSKGKRKWRVRSILSPWGLFRDPEPDFFLIILVVGFLVFGWVMVYSTSALYALAHYGDQYFFIKRQFIWSLVGLMAFIAATNIPLPFWQKRTRLLYGISVVLLILVVLVGPEVAGAKRWLRFGSFSFQPSEFGKLALIFLISDFLDRRQSRLQSFSKGLLPLLVMVGVLFILIFIEPDLGTPLLMGGVLLSMLVLGGIRFKHLLLMALGVLPFLLLSIFMVRYRFMRLMAYLNPWSDPQGAGYQLVQSLLALGSGGIFGKGLGKSALKMSYLPDAHTDFVFSILGEELGLLGTLACLILFFSFTMRGLRISRSSPNYFSSLVAAGISLTIGYQAIINMGVASGLFPTKGMPLPFLSFGGSSLVVTLFSLGILTQISKYGHPAHIKEA